MMGDSKNFREVRNSRIQAQLINPLGAVVSVSTLSDEELYRKCRECGQNAKLWSRKFAALLPEVAKRGLHRRKGFISIHEFAGKVAGMSEYAVDRVLHLHSKIKDKPALLKIFESGAEGWSKIEVVCHVATTETEKLWAEKVSRLSMAALSELVKNYRLKTVGADYAQNKSLFSQYSAAGEGPASGQISSFEPPVRFSFPASREVEFDLRLAKQKLEKQSKQPLSWNETFQMIIQKSDLSKGDMGKKEVCSKCSKKIAVLKICEECSKMLGEPKQAPKSGEMKQ